jgi:DNA-directed RNA polymerase subunit RPC12/RpoP
MPEPKSLAEYAAEAAAGNMGIACPKCGCRDLRFSYNKDVPGGLDRVKRCRNCGTRVLTSEAVKRVLPPTGRESNSAERMETERNGDGDDG